MDHALRAPWLGTCALAALLALLLTTTSTLAQLPLEVSGLRGGRHVGSAGSLDSTPRAVAGLGYAYTEGVLDGSDTHQRAFAEIAAAYAPWSLLQLSLGFSARYDGHESERVGSDRGGALGTELRTRHALPLTRALSIGAQTRLHFPASSSARRGLRAASPELGLLGSYALARGSELSLAAGYRFDRSARSVSDVRALSAADRLGAALSRFDAVLLGALFSLPVGSMTGSLEGSWDISVGDQAPRALASPLRLRAAIQALWRRRYVPGLEVGVSPSARPSLARGARIEPRVWIALSFGILLAPSRTAGEPAPAPVSRPIDAAPEPAQLTVRVVDPSGAPVAGARVTLAREGSEQAVETDARGMAALAPTERQGGQLRVEREGFEPHTAELADIAVTAELAITLARALPEGEIKGKVRSLRGGRPVQAHVRVEPLGLTLETSAGGDFVVPVPSGRYTLEISAAGYEPQRRPAQVEHHGVTILVVDLRRARR